MAELLPSCHAFKPRRMWTLEKTNVLQDSGDTIVGTSPTSVLAMGGLTVPAKPAAILSIETRHSARGPCDNIT